MTTYELRRGVRLQAEDVVIVSDDPKPGRTAVTVLAPPPRAAKGRDTAQAVLDLQAKKRKPWEDAHPKLKQTFNLHLRDELHKKLTHCAAIVPGMSMQKIATLALEEKVAELLAKYDRD
jgi:hypothetical protein